jgi:hypothetical protein
MKAGHASKVVVLGRTATAGRMSRYISFGGQKQVALICLLSGAIAVACLIRLWLFPTVSVGGDAQIYTVYALGFREHGFLSELGSVRTYGYPAFLYLVSFLAPPGGRGLWLDAGLVQYGLFLTSTLWLASLLRQEIPRFALAVLIGLLLNPFLISIVVDCLTEGLLASVMVLLTALILCASKSTSIASLLAALIAGALTSCFALMIRPAAIPVTIAWAIASFAVLWSSPRLTTALLAAHRSTSLSLRSFRTRMAALNAVLLLAACCITWVPQMHYNWVTWGELSFFPVCQLDQLQIASSITILRYETVAHSGGLSTFFYLNPFSTDDVVKGHPVNWYLDHPIAALKTTVLRVFAGLSINHLFTYVYPGRQALELGLLVGYWALICLGMLRVTTLYARAPRNLGGSLPRSVRAGAIFITGCTAGVLALNSFTWIELRFNLIPIGVLSVFGVDALLARQGILARAKVLFLAALVACVLTACSVLYLSTYGTAGPGRIFPKVTLPTLKCYIFSSEAPGRE